MEKIWDASHDVDFQNWLAFLDSGGNFCGGVIYFKLKLISVFWKNVHQNCYANQGKWSYEMMVETQIIVNS